MSAGMIVLITLIVLAIFLLALEVSFQAFYSGPERWRRWAWYYAHGLRRLAARERARIYIEAGLQPPRDEKAQS